MGELSRREIGEIASPAWVVDAHARTVARRRQCGRGGDHSIPHERRRPHRTVVRSRDRVADAGIDAVEPIPGRDLDVSLDHAWLAAQPEEPVAPAAGAGHLIHDPAGCADHVVLHGLAGPRELRRGHPDSAAGDDDRSRSDFERRRRGDSSSFGHRRIDEQPEPGGRASPLSRGALQAHLHDAHDVACPPVSLASRKPRSEPRRGAQRSTRFHERGELDREEMPSSLAARREVAAQRSLLLQDRGGRALERQLQHPRPAVVGDPAHDVESPRRAGDVEGRLAGEELPQAGICLLPQGPQAVEPGLEPHQVARGADVRQTTQPDHGNRPRRRKAPRKTGSTRARRRSFA